MQKVTVVLFIMLFSFDIHKNRGNYTFPTGFQNYESVIKSIDEKDTITKNLLKIRYKKYINKSISHLLGKIKMEYLGINFVQMKPNYLAFVSVRYSDYISIDIYTEKYEYLKRELNADESSEIWKIEELLKEKVTKIRVRNRFGVSLKEYPQKPVLPVI